jgi:hypothetical protein
MYQLIDNINAQIETYVSTMQVVSADKLGLDIRAGYKLYVDGTCIVVNKRNDRNLQYYGGFEYCEEFRQELGDYVVYFEDGGRISDCISMFYELQDEI